MSFQLLGIDHIQLATPPQSETKARAFFGGILGLQEVPKPLNLQARGGVWFQCGEQQIHIGVQKDFLSAKKAHPAFLVQDLAKLGDHLRTHGVEIIEDEPLEGAIRFYVLDPFGNRLEFLERQ